MDRTEVDSLRDSIHVRCPGDGTVAVRYDSSATVAQLITSAVTDGDLPRADFQGNPLPWHLADSDGAMIEPEATLLAVNIGSASDVSVTGPGVDEIVAKRDEWLDDVRAQADGTAPAGSVHANTLLALVRRTGSALDDVEDLSARVGVNTAPSTIISTTANPSVVPRIAAALTALAAVGLVWAWVFTDWLSASDGEADQADNARFNVPLTEEGSIDFEGEEDEYEFGAVAGQRIRIRMVSNQNGRLDPELILYQPDGAQIARNDDNGFDGTLNSLIDIEIPADGTYEIVARGLGGGGVGDYEVTIEDAGDLADFAEDGADLFGDFGFERGFEGDAIPADEFDIAEAPIPD